MQKDAMPKSMKSFLSGFQDSLTIHQNMPDGFTNLTAYSILPGIFLVINDIHTQSVPSNRENMPQDILVINYCTQGRCEFNINEDSYSYVDTNIMNISSQMVSDAFFYPSSYYLGYEVYVLSSRFTDETRKTLELFSIDIKELIPLYQNGAAFYAPVSIVRLWKHIADNCTTDNIGQLRLDTLQLLKYFCDNKPLKSANILYLSKVQAMLAKKAQEMLTRDLSSHLSMKSVSEELGVSETSLKRYFQAVYGTNISTYMNETRMKYAARLLSSSKDSVSDIAKACGYVNQGRFASVFREFYGMKPLDYRRNAKGLTE